MPTNVQVVSALIWNPVAPDQECYPGTLNQLGPILANALQVNTNTTTSGGGSSDSVAQQALNVANTALAEAQAALAAVPNRRTSGSPLAIATGDSLFSISWSPSLPDTNYEVRMTYYGTAVYATQFYGYMVVDGSRTVDGCQIRLDNTPANTKVSWVAEKL